MKLPQGYRYSAVYAGIRKAKKDDLALIVPDVPASGAAVFTQNRVQAAPVRIARWHLTKSRGQVSAVLVNAGLAELDFCDVSTDDAVAVEQAFRHLAALGHERIGLVVGPADHLPSQRKLAAFRRIAGQLGPPHGDKCKESVADGSY